MIKQDQDRMDNYAQLVSLVSALLALNHWNPEGVSQVLGTKLVAVEARTPKLRCYAADGFGAVSRLTLDHPVYGGQLGWTIRITPVPGPAADPLVALGGILPSDAKMQLSGAPTPGSAAPHLIRHTRTVRDDGRDIVFSFEGPSLKSPQVLTGITLRRPHPNIGPTVYAADRFRAVSIPQSAGTSFIIEHRDGERAAVRVLELKQEGRAMRIKYASEDPFIDEELARALIRRKLLEEHLEHRYHGKVDRLVFENAEMGTVVEVVGML
jgi:hypothetical protein